MIATLAIVAAGVAALLVLVLRFRIPAFVALLVVSVAVGMALGLGTAAVVGSIREGMGSTLGYIAVVVGLGAMFGELLEFSGGLRSIADRLLARSDDVRATWGLAAAGLLVGIPVFFDVGFILLVPLVYQLSQRKARAPVYFAIPLLAGLLVGHAFIPPTPGPLAVAELLKVDLGWAIAMGLACGVPAAIVAGPLYARRFRHLPMPASTPVPVVEASGAPAVSWGHAVFALVLPLALIVGNTVGGLILAPGKVRDALAFIGHPYIALLLSVAYAFLAFGVARGVPLEKLQAAMTRALEPAGIVVLVTGAGGVLKQVLVDSGAGQLMGEFFAERAVPPMLLGFLLAALIRIAQGSATVAMITAAGLVAPILAHLSLSQPATALVVVAIAAGGSLCSHVNDSGFWLVNRYLGQTEAETLRSWTVLSTLTGITGFLTASAIAVLL